MKIAFATKDMKNINDHFGWAQQFAVYEINETNYKPLDAVKFEQEMNEGDDKLEPKIAALSDCAIVYSTQIGPVAAAKLIKRRIHPMKTKDEELIEEILMKLLAALQGTPAPWLRKILNQEKGG